MNQSILRHVRELSIIHDILVGDQWLNFKFRGQLVVDHNIISNLNVRYRYHYKVKMIQHGKHTIIMNAVCP